MKKDKTHIHWYPGHIAKAEKKLKEQLSLVDAVIEVVDARLPISSCYDNISGLLNGKPRFLLVNKSDLVDKNLLKPYIEELKKRFEIPVIVTEAKNNKDINTIVKKAIELSEPRIQALMAKGLLRRPARIMVVGLPNVGNLVLSINLHVLLKQKLERRLVLHANNNGLELTLNLNSLIPQGLSL